MSAARPLSPTPTPIDRQLIANDFRARAKGKLPAEQIESISRALVADTKKYPAHGALASLGVYIRLRVDVNDGKSYVANGGGLFTPGGGALFGDVYTDDINRLYSNTVSFAIEATNVYVSVQFFDGNGSLLGHLQAGAVSTVTGAGGGTGYWS